MPRNPVAPVSSTPSERSHDPSAAVSTPVNRRLLGLRRSSVVPAAGHRETWDNRNETERLKSPGRLRGVFGVGELALDQVQPGLPEAGIGEIHADDRADLLGVLGR